MVGRVWEKYQVCCGRREREKAAALFTNNLVVESERGEKRGKESVEVVKCPLPRLSALRHPPPPRGFLTLRGHFTTCLSRKVVRTDYKTQDYKSSRNPTPPPASFHLHRVPSTCSQVTSQLLSRQETATASALNLLWGQRPL